MFLNLQGHYIRLADLSKHSLTLRTVEQHPGEILICSPLTYVQGSAIGTCLLKSKLMVLPDYEDYIKRFKASACNKELGQARQKTIDELLFSVECEDFDRDCKPVWHIPTVTIRDDDSDGTAYHESSIKIEPTNAQIKESDTLAEEAISHLAPTGNEYETPSTSLLILKKEYETSDLSDGEATFSVTADDATSVTHETLKLQTSFSADTGVGTEQIAEGQSDAIQPPATSMADNIHVPEASSSVGCESATRVPVIKLSRLPPVSGASTSELTSSTPHIQEPSNNTNKRSKGRRRTAKNMSSPATTGNGKLIATIDLEEESNNKVTISMCHMCGTGYLKVSDRDEHIKRLYIASSLKHSDMQIC